ncbi:MAG: hypothetical protein K8T90_04660 [Planctomycetes bacterium]|nr:hypothetical protein [Planctomycetota bacterium]
MTQSSSAGDAPSPAARGARFHLRTIHLVVAATVAVLAALAIVAIRFYLEIFPATDVHLLNESSEVLRDVRFIAEAPDVPGRATRRGWQFATFETLPPGASVEAPYDRRGHFLRVEFERGGVRHVWREVYYVDSDEWGALGAIVRPGPQLFRTGEMSAPLPEEPR